MPAADRGCGRSERAEDFPAEFSSAIARHRTELGLEESRQIDGQREMIEMDVPPRQGLVCRFIERWLGTGMASVAPRSRIGRIAAPLLLLHGEDDRVIPATHMGAAAGGDARAQLASARASA